MILTRVEVYCKEYRSDKDNPTTMQDIDDTLPFYPEIVFYSVFSITIGEEQCCVGSVYTTDAFLNIRVAYSPSCKIPHYLVIVSLTSRPLPSCPPES